jgi:DNA-binding NtrC family response regulator
MLNENEWSDADQPDEALVQPQLNPRQRILVVQDEGDLRQLSAEVLIDAGYQVEIAEDGVAAWAALQHQSYDLLITDQFLPKLSGVELLKKLHTARMALPVIMATEILPTWEFAMHPCLRAVTMLRKPYTFVKLLGMVKSILPTPSIFRAEMEPLPTWQRPTATASLRL